MDIQRKCFEESNNVNPDWSFKFNEELQQYIALDSEMELQVDEFNELWDAFRAGWQAAKAQAVPAGFVLMPIKPTETMVAAVAKEHEGDAFLPYSLYDAYVKQAMIEAQEQAND